MAAMSFFEQFFGDLGTGVHDLNGDTLKVYLSNAAPSASADSDKTDLAEISGGNGYTSGGADITNAYSQSSGTGSLTATDVSWTATGGTVGAFRYAVLYNDTAANDDLIG